jgi:hypothetical protein
VKDWDKILVHIVVFLSFCWVAHGTLTIFYCCYFVEMTDFSFASEIKFVPTLHLSTSPTE